jgi:cell division septation protein DedD
MYKLKGLLAVLACAAVIWAANRSAFDLMLQGHYGEAKAILNNSNLSPRYELLYYALTESDAARACSLYQVIAIRYSNSDCDSVARNRLDQARDIGFTVVPIAEWSQAGPEVPPLYSAKRVELPHVGAQITAPDTAVRTEPSAPKADSVAAKEPPPQPPVATSEVAPNPTNTSAPITVSVPDLSPKAEDVPVNSPLPVVKDEPAPVISIKTEDKPAASVVDSVAPEEKQDEVKPVETKPVETTPPNVPAELPVVKDTVTQAVPDSATLKPKSKPVASGHWYVQVGAFLSAENAHRLEAALQKAGYTTKIVPKQISKGTLLQVRVGAYATRSSLNEVLPKLKEQFNVPTVVVSE